MSVEGNQTAVTPEARDASAAGNGFILKGGSLSWRSPPLDPHIGDRSCGIHGGRYQAGSSGGERRWRVRSSGLGGIAAARAGRAEEVGAGVGGGGGGEACVCVSVFFFSLEWGWVGVGGEVAPAAPQTVQISPPVCSL